VYRSRAAPIISIENLLAHAPEGMHEEIDADYTDMIYAATPEFPTQLATAPDQSDSGKAVFAFGDHARHFVERFTTARFSFPSRRARRGRCPSAISIRVKS
jgi:hypothetical protein